MQDKFTVASFREAKKTGTKITMLTAYDYPTAKIIDEAGVDSILVGDSLGMVVLGYEDTTKVTMEDMIHHIKAVTRGVKHAMVVGDMPFLSYHQGVNESVRNAGRLVSEGGCKSIKLEGGREVAADVKAIIRAGIPVMGHLGYTPQSVNVFGGHKAQGKTHDTARTILEDALILQDAGAFAVVLECVPYLLAGYISSKLDIPIIGIGSGPDCDGQVLVSSDIMGLFRDFTPKHSKVYQNMGDAYEQATKDYINEVRSGIFPTVKNSFIMEEAILEMVKQEVDKERKNISGMLEN
ncbi:MAG: 3-methyl-2-oxobutanoate hydroxymethyltransferase, partial [Clostridiales bacterium]|nr:3-methyl-2-oxobutanoate hydroxymethyltransferase [Clostridiales bacterium]